jgi:hypothetical protein
MNKNKSIKEKLIATTQNARMASEEHLNKLDLNERIHRAEIIVKSKESKNVIEKVVRDAFTMQQDDVEAIKKIRQKCLKAGIEVNKSLIVRAGIQVLSNMPINKLEEIIISIPKIKVGRPKS